MKLIIFYLLGMLILYAGLSIAILLQLPDEFAIYRTGLLCSLIGGIAGCTYCLRGVYVNHCALNQWSERWHVWYFLRPVVSLCSGAISYLFLRAGLLVLDSGIKPDSAEFGFYAFAFVAGFNVDKFFQKIEEVAAAVFGIEKSKSASPSKEQ